MYEVYVAHTHRWYVHTSEGGEQLSSRGSVEGPFSPTLRLGETRRGVVGVVGRSSGVFSAPPDP